MPELSEKIDWNDEVMLKTLLKEECFCKKPYRGLEQKRMQLIEYMTTGTLSKHLDYENIDVGKGTLKRDEKRTLLLQKINGFDLESSSDEDEHGNENPFSNDGNVITSERPLKNKKKIVETKSQPVVKMTTGYVDNQVN